MISPLRWQEIDGEWLVFGSATGSLQHLDVLGAAVLAMLEDAPGSVSDIAMRIAQATEVVVTPDLSERIGATLENLQRTGFLECRTQ